MMEHNQILELLPLYALDALEGAERDEVEAHMDECELCLLELGRFQTVTAAFAEDEPPPQHLWERIHSALGEEPELGHAAEVIDLSELDRRRNRAVLWAAAAAAVVALVLGGIALSQRAFLNDLTGEQAVVAAAEQAADSPGAFVGEFLVGGNSVAGVVLTVDGRGFIVPTDQLEPLDPARTYQLWVITADEKVISGGVLGRDPKASTFTWTGEISGFALTREMAGGVVVSEGDVVALATEA